MNEENLKLQLVLFGIATRKIREDEDFDAVLKICAKALAETLNREFENDMEKCAKVIAKEVADSLRNEFDEKIKAIRETAATHGGDPVGHRAWQRGVKLLKKILPELKEKYFGKWVALLEGKVYDSDTKEFALARRVYKAEPEGSFYFAEVTDELVEYLNGQK